MQSLYTLKPMNKMASTLRGGTWSRNLMPKETINTTVGERWGS